MYDALLELARRPEPWSRTTVRELWTRPHLAQQMLKYHLSQETDHSSRRTAQIDDIVDWLDAQLDLDGMRVIDLGCGPGLYARRMARRGARVTGVDFSAHSLDYARGRDSENIAYLEADYLLDPLPDGFDMAAIIYYDSRHKNDPMAPMVMALCRSLIYVTTSFAISGIASEAALGAAAACFCYTAGLTYVASRENLSEIGNLWPVAVIGLPVIYGLPWALAGIRESVVAVSLLGAWIGYSLSFAVRARGRSVPGAVVRLIAGMALLDAMLLAGNGFDTAAIAAAAMLPLTRMFQRFVPGT